MLNYFDPRELGLRSGTMFSPRDVSSFTDIGYSAITVAKECLSRVVESNRTSNTTETLGFRSDVGWASQGKLIMVAIDRDVVKRAYVNVARSNKLHWCLSLGHRLGYRQKSTTGGVQRRDCSTLQFDNRGPCG